MSDAIVGVTGVSATGQTKLDYDFSVNWFSYAEKMWPDLVRFIPNEGKPRRFLEIGSFEGKSATWIIENMMQPGDTLLCVDTWKGGFEHADINMAEVERRFDHNIAVALNKSGMDPRCIRKIKEDSVYALAYQMRWLPSPSHRFEFIYIDGSHQAPDVLTDAVMAWQLLAMGGIMIFDDYLWGDPRLPLQRPKFSIDAFMNIFGGEINVMHLGLQVVIKKAKLP